MEQLRSWLENMVAALRFVDLVVAVIALISRMRDINLELTKRVAHLTRKRPRSETLERLERQLVLPLAGLIATSSKASAATEHKPKKRRRSPKAGGRGSFPDHLRRIPVHNPVTPEQRRCPLCGAVMRTIAHSTCERLTVIPAQIVVEQRFDETVACPNDDTIFSAPPPPAIVNRGVLSDTLIVETTCDKFLDHLPTERQCRRFARVGVRIAPQTLGRSVAAHTDLLAPLARLISEQTRAPGLLGTDATGIPILDPDAPDGIRSGTMWCWTNARWVSFFYSASGNSDSVRKFLGDDLRRIVQCDGTNILTFLERSGGKRPGCWAHGRRGFVEAARGGDKIAIDGLRKIALIFVIERESALAGDSAEERRARRVAHTLPILDELRLWVDEQRAVIAPKTPLGAALGYLHRQWKRLILFVDDGNIEATNNRRERELRQLVLGRKNWLFAWLDVGGENVAAILTIIATCIAHDVNPRAYLHVVTKLIVDGWPNSKLRELLPDRIVDAHPELFAGDPDALPAANGMPLLPARA